MELLLDISLLRPWSPVEGHNENSGETLLSNAQDLSPNPISAALCHPVFLFPDLFLQPRAWSSAEIWPHCCDKLVLCAWASRSELCSAAVGSWEQGQGPVLELDFTSPNYS